MRLQILNYSIVLAFFIFGCGGLNATSVETGSSKVEQSEIAIGIVRHSFETMGGTQGGVQRLKHSGSKVKIYSTVTAKGKTFPVVISLGGPNHYRIDLIDEQISYIYNNVTCQKVIFGILAHCTSEESQWITPTRILYGLTLPAGDAAQLDSTFRLRDDIIANGQSCSVVEIKPKNSNLKFRSAYNKTTGLLVQSTFYFKDSNENKTNWQVNYGDWREANKMLAPFSKTVSVNGTLIWHETVESLDYEGSDEKDFIAPVPPTTDSPLPAFYPARKIVRTNLHSIDVEIPTPTTTIGAGSCIANNIEELSPGNVIQIIHKGPLSQASSFFSQLDLTVQAMQAKAVGQPRIMVLESASSPDDAVLMLIYVQIQN